jgi:large subunit ribosomal protein L20
MRVTNAPASRKRRTRMIRAAKGFRMRRSKLYRYASDAVDHGRQYAFRDRKTKKRNFRRLGKSWLTSPRPMPPLSANSSKSPRPH